MSVEEEEIFLPVPEERMRQAIGIGGRRINEIKLETRTAIKPVNDPLGKGFGFSITGTTTGREEAKQAITHFVVSTIFFCMSWFFCYDLFIPWYDVISFNQKCRSKL